jgi:hypothetical protein
VFRFFGSPLRAMRDRRRTAITFLFLLCAVACIFIALKLDHRLAIAPGSTSRPNESGWSITFIPIWCMIIPAARLVFIYRRTAEEKRSDQYIYSIPIFFCFVLPAYMFVVLLTLQLDTIISFPFIWLLAPLLFPVVAVPACQAILYWCVVKHQYE